MKKAPSCPAVLSPASLAEISVRDDTKHLYDRLNFYISMRAKHTGVKGSFIIIDIYESVHSVR